MAVAEDLAKKPVTVRVHVTTGTGVDISWADGHSSHFDFMYLRDHCPCANCKDERTRKSDGAMHVAAAVPSLGHGVLPMFKPKPKARRAEVIGRYAIQLDFTDGHSAGIYSYDYLRMICPCDECTKNFGSRSS